MIVAINIGNTNTVVGVWNDKFLLKARIPTTDIQSIELLSKWLIREMGDNNINPSDIEGSIIASVVPDKTHILRNTLIRLLGNSPIILEKLQDIKNIEIDFTQYDTSLLGIDRVICCMSALKKYAPPLVVYDLGTATTVNVVDSSGCFVGGAILPGLKMGLAVLANDTALLPQIELGTDVPFIGHNTKECMLAGAMYGTASVLDGFAKRFIEIMGRDTSFVLTGGNSDMIMPFCSTELYHETDLLLNGLVQYYKRG